MPNHITNIIAVSGDASRIRTMLKEVQTGEYGIGSIDFNKIIPMPDNVDSYNWAIANWGTKWNSYGYTEETDFKDGKLTFLTAWSAPHPILQKLSEMYPDIRLEHEWADEDIGMNCGRHEYFDGERIGEYYPESNRERIEFAARVMGSDPSEWSLFLNASETDYVFFTDEEFEVVEVAGQTALFTNGRMTDADIPKGLHCYHLRQGDDGNFCTLEKSVKVNHAGSVITREPLDLGEKGYISFDNDSSPNFTGETMLMEEFVSSDSGQSESMDMGVS
ncbi:MAG: hypothetical protein IJ666_01705 [Ruminococcus sp.]|nr:hypothetical protein [Ruminococcus sp.]